MWSWGHLKHCNPHNPPIICDDPPLLWLKDSWLQQCVLYEVGLVGFSKTREISNRRRFVKWHFPTERGEKCANSVCGPLQQPSSPPRGSRYPFPRPHAQTPEQPPKTLNLKSIKPLTRARKHQIVKGCLRATPPPPAPPRSQLTTHPLTTRFGGSEHYE